MVTTQVTAMSLAFFQRTARGLSAEPIPMIEVATTWVVETGAPMTDAVRMTMAEVSCELRACEFSPQQSCLWHTIGYWVCARGVNDEQASAGFAAEPRADGISGE